MIQETLDAMAANMKYFQLECHEESLGMWRGIMLLLFFASSKSLWPENDEAIVIELVMNSNNEEIVSILPIVGMGGIGKTKIAQLIFNDEKIQRKIWAKKSCLWLFQCEKILLKRY